MKQKSKQALTPKLRFPEFRNEPGWEENTLSALARSVTTKAEPTDPSHILTLSGEHGLVLQSEYFGKRVAGTRSERYTKIARNDFVYNDRTTKESPWGTIKRLSSYDNGIVSPIYKCFRFAIGENPVFWDCYFASGSHNAELRGMVNEGARAGRFNISIDKFLGARTWHPSKSEQQKIADCLSSLDEVIAAQARKVEALKAHKKGLMQQFFPCDDKAVPRIRFPEFRDRSGWKSYPLYDLLNDVLDFRGRTPQKLGMEWGNGSIISLSANNVKNGFIDYDAECYLGSEDLYRRWMGGVNLEQGDLVFTMEAPLGNALLIPDSRKYILSQRVVAFKTKPFVDNRFLIQVVWGESFQRAIGDLATGSTAKGVSQKALQSVRIALPEKDEQQRIAEFFSALDHAISSHVQQLQALKTHKQGLMQQLFPSPEEPEA